LLLLFLVDTVGISIPEVIKALVIPKIKSISERIESCIEGQGLSSVDKNGAGHIKTLLVVKLILKAIRHLFKYME